VHELREQIHQRVERRHQLRLSMQFESFGFKYGIPGDADFVFDARSLPNPYWDKTLRDLDGRAAPVIEFLERHSNVRRYIADIITFMEPRLPEFAASNRRYLTVAIGCTGGQHRSVYIAEQLALHFAVHHVDVRVRHAALAPNAG
jgi:RNase adapter protein RapZ